MRFVATSMVLVVFSASIFGQTRQSGGPVDQAVGDLDPLGTSLRRVEPGLAQFNPRAALRELPAAPWTVGLLPAPSGQRYVYQAPGFRAYFDQPDYLVIGAPDTGPRVRRNVSPGIDGGFLPVAPANLVYDLRPRPARTLPLPEVDPNWTDTRLDTRLVPIAARPLDASFNNGATGNVDLTPVPAAAPKRPAKAKPEPDGKSGSSDPDDAAAEPRRDAPAPVSSEASPAQQ